VRGMEMEERIRIWRGVEKEYGGEEKWGKGCG
jgi:hypothetical protein